MSDPSTRPRRPVAAALFAVLLAAPFAPASAQDPGPLGTPRDGPVIHGFGAVFDVPFLDVETPVEMEYRVLFDVSRSAEPGSVNPYLNTVARFLNMHARAGVPVERLHVAVVLHGDAAKDALLEEPFRERFGADNANLELLRRLAEAGVDLYMCGQSAMGRGLAPGLLADPVRMGLSAMTVRALLQERGYRPVN